MVLVGAEPEFKKIPRTFTEVDPVKFVIVATPREAIDALGGGSAKIMVVDLSVPEQALALLVGEARRASVRHIVAVSRRDTPQLRDRADRIDFDVAVFKRRPANTIIEVVRNTIQYEVRRAPRAVMANVVAANVAGQTLSGEGINIATQGLLVLLPVHLDKGAIANLAFDLPGRGHRVIATAKVARSVQGQSGFLVGMQFEAISEADREQIAVYVRRTLEPPDPKYDPLQRVRKAARTSPVEIGLLRACVCSTTTKRRDYFRVRDLSEVGAFLYPKPTFDHPHSAGAQVAVILRGPGTSLSIDARVQRVTLRGTLEGQLFPMGFAVEFTDRVDMEAIARLTKG